MYQILKGLLYQKLINCHFYFCDVDQIDISNQFHQSDPKYKYQQ